jgi:Zn-dependent protease
MLFSFHEIIDIVIMTLAIGFVFRDYFHFTPKVEVLTPEYYLGLAKKKRFRWSDFWFAAAIVAPSIILHEFGHKFVAIAFGMQATFQAAYTWLGIGILLKILGVGFVFFVPAFTAITGAGTDLQFSAIAFAGPAVNLAIWLVALITLKVHKKMKNNTFHFLHLIKKINIFLFIFNMLPIPMFDGYSVFSGLAKVLF